MVRLQSKSKHKKSGWYKRMRQSKDNDKIDLSSVNKSKRQPLAKLRNSLKKPAGPNRDAEGKFSSNSGLRSIQKLNLRHILPIITAVALLGGFYVWRSNAATPLAANESFAKGRTEITGGRLVNKSNGSGYVRIATRGPNTLEKELHASVSIPMQTLERSLAVCAQYLMSKESKAAASLNVMISYSEGGQTKTDFAPVGGYDLSDIKHCVKIDPSKAASLARKGVGTATITVRLQPVSSQPSGSTQPVASALLYRIFGIKSAASATPNSSSNPSSSPNTSTANPKFGFTWTQENIVIPKSSKADVANIHMYGWGSLWPFSGDAPSGEADGGGSVGNRINQATANGQEVMITACCAPSTYNTTGKAWDLNNSRVRADREQDYANRVAELVRKYPQIKYVQVWNEMKGYWSGKNLNAQAYTQFYNKVYSAVKTARSSVQVGGGYVVQMASNNGGAGDERYSGAVLNSHYMATLQYWLNNATGFDAVVLDAFVRANEFPMIMNYVRTMPGVNNKPIWWAEFYNRKSLSTPFEDSGDMYEAGAQIAKAMRSGDIALYWAERKYTPSASRPLW